MRRPPLVYTEIQHQYSGFKRKKNKKPVHSKERVVADNEQELEEQSSCLQQAEQRRLEDCELI